jgi:3-oxoacyl-[acyl-carrier protein] reductase
MTGDEMQPLVSLDDGVIIVTGAGQGIGKAIAEAAAGIGASVAIIDLNRENAEAVAGAIGDRATAYVGDVSDPAFVQQTIDAVVKANGKITGLVNNAGITRPAMIEKMTLEQWNQVLNVHLTGSFLFMQAVGRHMIGRFKEGDKTPGAIVNNSSDAGRCGSIGQINYAAAKAGMLGMTMSGAKEWSRYGVRVNTLCFGVIETPMTETIRGERFRDGVIAQIPLGRWAQPSEAASAACFLLSNAASYITGQHLSVNGGYFIAS